MAEQKPQGVKGRVKPEIVPVELVAGENSASAKQRKKTAKEQMREQSRYERIRDNIIKSSLGFSMDSDELDKYKKAYEEFLAKGGKLDKTDAEELHDLKEHSDNLHDAANNVGVGLVTGGVRLAVSSIPVVSVIVNSVLYGVDLVKAHKMAKQKKGSANLADKNLYKKIQEVMTKVQILEVRLEAMHEEILAKSKTFKTKEEYNAYILDVSKLVMAETKRDFAAGLTPEEVAALLKKETGMGQGLTESEGPANEEPAKEESTSDAPVKEEPTTNGAEDKAKGEQKPDAPAQDGHVQEASTVEGSVNDAPAQETQTNDGGVVNEAPETRDDRDYAAREAAQQREAREERQANVEKAQEPGMSL